MQEEAQYLLKYVSNDTYKKIKIKYKDYMLDDLVDNRVDVDLNIRYLIRLGVKNIDNVVLERLDDLLISNNIFIKKMNGYIDKLSIEGLIDMMENS